MRLCNGLLLCVCVFVCGLEEIPHFFLMGKKMQLPRGNFLGANFLRGIFREGNFTWGKFSRRAVFRWAVFRGDNFLGGIFLRI